LIRIKLYGWKRFRLTRGRRRRGDISRDRLPVAHATLHSRKKKNGQRMERLVWPRIFGKCDRVAQWPTLSPIQSKKKGHAVPKRKAAQNTPYPCCFKQVTTIDEIKGRRPYYWAITKL
jgi:hypothetical protein